MPLRALAQETVGMVPRDLGPVQDQRPPADVTVAWRRDETSAVVKMFVGVVREMTRPR
jgi:hypothetical protein